MRIFDNTKRKVRVQLKRAESSHAKAARELTRDLVGMDDAQLAALAARCEATGEWDCYELVQRWRGLSLHDRAVVARHFAK